jgi:hypothetical protein
VAAVKRWLQWAAHVALVAGDKTCRAAVVAWRELRAAWRRHRQAVAAKRVVTIAAKKERDARRKAELDASFRTEVMSYRSKRALEKDAQLRYADDWRMEGQLQQPSRAMVGSKIATAGCLGLLLPGVGCLSIFIPQRTHPPITVTWAKDPVNLQLLPGSAPRR